METPTSIVDNFNHYTWNVVSWIGGRGGICTRITTLDEQYPQTGDTTHAFLFGFTPQGDLIMAEQVKDNRGVDLTGGGLKGEETPKNCSIREFLEESDTHEITDESNITLVGKTMYIGFNPPTVKRPHQNFTFQFFCAIVYPNENGTKRTLFKDVYREVIVPWKDILNQPKAKIPEHWEYILKGHQILFGIELF